MLGLIAFGGLCVQMIVMAGGPQATDTAKADEAAVRAVVDKYTAARDRADEAAIRALFTADADQLVSTGEWRRGRDELVKGTVASSRSNAGARTIAIETVRIVSPGVAIADGRYTIAATGTTAARNKWTSFVVVKAGTEWRIAAIRNMLPAAAAPPK
jgi:uncharacterized protein (TIGR02246 family)